MKINQQAGFSLIEMMMVVAIVGVLASMAMPAYQDYMVKAKVSEILLAGSPCRATISETVQSMSGTAIGTANQWGCEVTNPSKMVAAVSTDANGIITVKPHATNLGINLNAANDFVTITPYLGGNTIVLDEENNGQGNHIEEWRCKAHGALLKYVPGSCR